MQTERRSEPVTAKTLTEIRCTGSFQGEPCNRILLRSTMQPIRQGGMLEIKCGRCNEVSFLIGGPLDA
jgi:phage FluMu protein Com